VGRVISLKKEGDSVKAVLGPIQLTDVIKNGKFKMDSPVTAENMISYVAPDFPQEPDQQPENKKSSNNLGHGPQVEGPWLCPEYEVACGRRCLWPKATLTAIATLFKRWETGGQRRTSP
jgi:hypothetical protein